MKIVILVILIVGVCGEWWKNEVNLGDFYDTFDQEISGDMARKFKFPTEKGLDFKNTPECRKFKEFPRPKDSCPAPKGFIAKWNNGCEKRKCIQESYFGSTKCSREVKLLKPFPHAGIECKKPKASCKFVKPQDHKEPPKDGKPHLYPKPSTQEFKLYPEPETQEFKLYPEPEKDEDAEKDEDVEKSSCECFTIWCFRTIHTIYQHGRLYVGDVVIKTPCGCDCRDYRLHG